MENQGKFVQAVLVAAGKTQTDLLVEQAIEFVENATIDIQAEIAKINTFILPNLTLELSRAEKALAKKEKEFEVIRFSIPANKTAQGLLDARYNKQFEINNCKENVSEIQHRIEKAEGQLTELQAVLADLQA
jgi:hypothetical protein